MHCIWKAICVLHYHHHCHSFSEVLNFCEVIFITRRQRSICFEKWIKWIYLTNGSKSPNIPQIHYLIFKWLPADLNPQHRTDKYSQLSLIIWPVWPSGWVFVYELCGCGIESRCSHWSLQPFDKTDQMIRCIYLVYSGNALVVLLIFSGFLVKKIALNCIRRFFITGNSLENKVLRYLQFTILTISNSLPALKKALVFCCID